MIKQLAAIWCFVTPLFVWAQTIPADALKGIGISVEFPQYWTYDGSPILLLGASDEDNLFQMPDVEAQLDLLQSVGGNYVRCTMSSRDEGNVWPFFFDETAGVYDLNRWNSEYWRRFDHFLRACAERDIIVQIEIWATFDFYRENWNEKNPFNPKHNKNYTAKRTKLPTEVNTHPVFCDNNFFWSVPLQDNNMPVLSFQQKFVDKLLAHSLSHANILYCIDNETSVTAAWSRFWTDYLLIKAKEEGRTIYVTEMWDPHDLNHVSHRETFDNPQRYAFVDISQNNHQREQAHWDNGLLQINRLEKLGYLRPVNNVKTYGSNGGRHGGNDDNAIQKYIRSSLFGCAAVRFHRPPSGLGLNADARSVIKSLRMAFNEVSFFEGKPRNDLLTSRTENEAYCRALPGKYYLVYFVNGGSVELDVSASNDRSEILWLDVRKSNWEKSSVFSGNKSIQLNCPGSGHWIAVVKH